MTACGFGRERLVLAYALAISRPPATVTDELFASMRAHFNERQLVELTNAIALENMRARFNHALDMTQLASAKARYVRTWKADQRAISQAEAPEQLVEQNRIVILATRFRRSPRAITSKCRHRVCVVAAEQRGQRRSPGRG